VHELLERYPNLKTRLPPRAEAVERQEPISYIQWEACLALFLRKMMLIVLPSETASRGPKFAPTAETKKAQDDRLKRLKTIDRFLGIRSSTRTVWATSVERPLPASCRPLDRLAMLVADPTPNSLLEVVVPSASGDSDAQSSRAGLYAYSLISRASAQDGGGVPGFTSPTGAGFRAARDVARAPRRSAGPTRPSSATPRTCELRPPSIRWHRMRSRWFTERTSKGSPNRPAGYSIGWGCCSSRTRAIPRPSRSIAALLKSMRRRAMQAIPSSPRTSTITRCCQDQEPPRGGGAAVSPGARDRRKEQRPGSSRCRERP
jgi:hypothetical protein